MADDFYDFGATEYQAGAGTGQDSAAPKEDTGASGRSTGDLINLHQQISDFVNPYQPEDGTLTAKDMQMQKLKAMGIGSGIILALNEIARARASRKGQPYNNVVAGAGLPSYINTLNAADQAKAQAQRQQQLDQLAREKEGRQYAQALGVQSLRNQGLMGAADIRNRGAVDVANINANRPQYDTTDPMVKQWQFVNGDRKPKDQKEWFDFVKGASQSKSTGSAAAKPQRVDASVARQIIQLDAAGMATPDQKALLAQYYKENGISTSSIPVGGGAGNGLPQF